MSLFFDRVPLLKKEGRGGGRFVLRFAVPTNISSSSHRTSVFPVYTLSSLPLLFCLSSDLFFSPFVPGVRCAKTGASRAFFFAVWGCDLSWALSLFICPGG
ncbi:hypothetical protein CSUI_003146 [Cystoisospora suis]|uniref:Uncharacterized protein n=1 Tax=Cystoisospora suis TaxID=483139 RepID=A0A2C6KG40_9APIC|nr:hypothetical protein CSUI_003146 [Cystoisospora suis]